MTTETTTLLRFITCGSVDDGKSTLIGRLLYEANVLFEDHLAALKSDSKRFGTQGEALDFALLLDGLTAEREQGITIDVAYRFFATGRRRFIVADTPGHEQYTRNMVTGASTADAAVLLVDARKGILTQTRRHCYIASLLGIRHVLLAVNKIDLVDDAHEAFCAIEREFLGFAQQIGLLDVACVPVSALHGDNILTSSERTRWYRGPTVMEYLEAVEIDDTRLEGAAFRLPVQWVNRPHADFRGFAGTIVSGTVRRGDRICVQPSGRETRVARIVAYDGDLDDAGPGQAVTLTLEDELDISRGDMICHADAPAEVADQFEATIVWMGERPMLAGRPYWIKIGTNTVTATMGRPKYRVNINTLEHVAATTLQLNEIGVCTVALDRRIAFDPYRVNRDTGGFIVIDRMSNNTVGAGLLHFALRRAHNIRWQVLDIDKHARAAQKGQRPCVLWFTGLSGAGKSTIANLVEKQLHGRGLHTYLLDGDNIRHHLNRDLGFTEADRVENIRRIAEVARLMVDAGLIVMVAFISPFRAERRLARSLVEEREFVEIFIDTPLSVAEARDPKGLYKKARQGTLKNFTGVDSPYERPQAAELTIDTTTTFPETAAGAIVEFLEHRGVIDVP